ncbi:DNA primase [Terribacillus sp. 7520-G]|uniref:DNA primase n=1 Tax=Terribacillus TaxID=459532 RepID=UPI000BA533CA|nr:DNA primase [Terribacillus sp. 7520-G]PAD39218.1 DNA primase [Terribacillus sp. 7520-G]
MAGGIPEEVVDEVRKSNDIVDVIGEHVQLKKQGRNYFGLCPFHGEKSPSFSVTQEKQIFHCFGCGKGGNVFTFLMELEGLSFSQAVQQLAKRSGTDLPAHVTEQQDRAQSREEQTALEANEWVVKLYHNLLRNTKEGKTGYEYLLGRGLTDETIDTFQLGFAPNSRDFTVKFLEGKGYKPQELLHTGLFSTDKENKPQDRFRGRVIFPIRNHLGKTVGFGGRTLGGDQEPKYLNSSESELFQKGRMLFNFDLARGEIRKTAQVVVFEGYNDVIAAYQAGVRNGVATLGTSLTETQARLLKRYAEQVVICYDGDKAGFEASYRALQVLRKAGNHVRVAMLRDGLDPDDFIREHGAEKFKRSIIDAALTDMSFMMHYLKQDFNLSIEGDRLQYVEKVLDEIAQIESSVEREHYLRELSNAMDLSVDTLASDLEPRLRKKENRRAAGNPAKPQVPKQQSRHYEKKIPTAYQTAEKQLLAHMLRTAAIADKVREEIGASFITEQMQVIATHLYAFYEEGHDADVSQFVSSLEDPSLQQLVIQTAMLPVVEDISDQEIGDYIRTIKNEQVNKTDINQLLAEQRQAEQENDPIRAAQIAMKIMEIRRTLKSSL